MMKMLKLAITTLTLLPLTLFATQYHSLSGSNWSHEKNGSNCGCSPNWGNDSIYIYHNFSRGSLNLNSGSFLYLGDGGNINVNNNSNWIINSSMVIEDGGELSASNKMSMTINGGGTVVVEVNGTLSFNNNLDFINNGTLIINGTLDGGNNATLTFQGGSTVELNGSVELSNGANITNETTISGTGTIEYSGGSFTNQNQGTINNCTNCSTGSPIYLGTQTPGGEITDVTMYKSGSWNNGTPDATLNAIIYESVTLNSSSLAAKNLVINPGAEVIIPATRTITVEDSIHNNGTIIINDNAALIQNGNADKNSGNGTYILNKTGSQSQMTYNKWSPPIPGQRILDVFPGANLYDLFTYEASTQKWKYDFETLTPENSHPHSPYTFQPKHMVAGADGIMNVGGSYFVPGNANNMRTFEGNSINNGNISVNVVTTNISTPSNWSGNDWNLIGNPYPSPINIQDFLLENYDNGNGAIGNAIYLWDGPNSQYITRNITDNELISLCQGFWVEAQNNGQVTFKNSMRGYQNNMTLRSTTEPVPGIYLSLTDSAHTDQIRVYLSQDASDGIDQLFDAQKMQNGNGFNFYTKIDSANYVFQSVTPPGLYGAKTVNLGLEVPNTNTHTIVVDTIIGVTGNYTYVLIDKKLNRSHTLEKGMRIEVEVDGGQSIDDRFQIAIKTDVENAEAETKDSETHSSDEQPDFISSIGAIRVMNETSKPIKLLNIYDLSGRLVHTMQNIDVRSSDYTDHLKTGIYIIRYERENETPRTEKVYVK